MTAASCQFGSMNDTTLPAGIRASRAAASSPAWAYRVAQFSRTSLSTNAIRSGVRCAAARAASASVLRTHQPRR
ncbi:hypothetical protein N602_01260 [Mycobacterium avium subsp. hominissuis 10-5606]|nr:hypothetical protein N602_01260 [Mycobacterium avium subsp. hominissuis 10-5606]